MRPSASERLRALAVEDPDRDAIVARDRTWSYAQLDAAVERMAAWLYARRTSTDGIGIVALRYRGTMPLIISSLAISRSGVVCALIDPLAPAARVRLVLDDLRTDAGPALLLSDAPSDIDDFPGSLLFAELPAIAADMAVPASAELGPDDLQNIIYTSGSTGVPSGLCVTGRQRDAVGAWIDSFVELGDESRVGLIAAGSIGQSGELPRIVLRAGATISVHDVLVDGLDTIPRWLHEQRVELVPFVPTLIRFLLPLIAEQIGPDGIFPDLRTVAVWGESSDWSDLTGLAHHLPPDARIFNAYGTTESGMIAALDLTAAEVGPNGGRAGPVPAGRPLASATVRILDSDGQDVAPGSHGEIAVSSEHLADGYWRRPDLTAAVFSVDADGRKLCRTGDGGRLDSDGVLHLTGRLDNIVKITGHRVSLDELEHAARDQPGVLAAAAVARPDPHGAMRLHLFVVPRAGAVIETRWLRAGIARALPPAFLPDTVDVLDSLPQLSNGKLDRRSLPAPAPRSVAQAQPPKALVSQMAALFAEVLGAAAIGPDEDFFELGGDSVRAGRVVAALQTRFGHHVPASLLLEASTPVSLAAALSRTQDAVLVPVRTTGGGIPLFVVHGGAGDVMWARSLATHIDEDRPVYALQPPPLLGPTPFVPTLREVAERYVAEVRRVWPDGPYRFFGYSMGGVIAFEMATILQDLGAEVDSVALGDSMAPELTKALHRQGMADEIARRARRSFPAKVAEHLRYRGAQVSRRLRREPDHGTLWNEFLTGGPPSPEVRGDAYLHVYGRLAAEHRFQRQLCGDLTIVAASRGRGPNEQEWQPHITGRIRTVVVDADHEGLVGGPALGLVARALTHDDQSRSRAGSQP